MLDADAVINNSSEKVGGSNAYPDPAPKKWVGPDPEKTHPVCTPVYRRIGRYRRSRHTKALTSSNVTRRLR